MIIMIQNPSTTIVANHAITNLVNNTTNLLSISVIIVDWIYVRFVLGVEIAIITHFANIVLEITTVKNLFRNKNNLKDIMLKVEIQVKAFRLILELWRNLKVSSVQEDTQHNLEVEVHLGLVGSSRVILEVVKELI